MELYNIKTDKLEKRKKQLEKELKGTNFQFFTDWVITSQELEAVTRELLNRRRDNEYSRSNN